MAEQYAEEFASASPNYANIEQAIASPGLPMAPDGAL